MVALVEDGVYLKADPLPKELVEAVREVGIAAGGPRELAQRDRSRRNESTWASTRLRRASGRSQIRCTYGTCCIQV